MLEYKAKELIAVRIRHLSLTDFQHVRGGGCRLAPFRCVACGRAQNADINGAGNILASGVSKANAQLHGEGRSRR